MASYLSYIPWTIFKLKMLGMVIYQFPAQSCLSLWYSHKQSVEEGDNSGPEIIKLFFMLNSAENEISTAYEN